MTKQVRKAPPRKPCTLDAPPFNATTSVPGCDKTYVDCLEHGKTGPPVTQETLEAWVQKWQRILRLQDWKVYIRLARAFDLNPEQAGCVAYLVSKKVARIKILDPRDYDPECWTPQDPEKTVVHELVHLHWAPVDDAENGTLKGKIIEQAVASIADALITCDRGGHPCVWVKGGVPCAP